MIRLPLFVLFLHVSLPVSADLRIADQNSEIVFQTASDFVRTGCGTLNEKSTLVLSDPLHACDIPSGPPTNILTSIYQSIFKQDVKHEWTLLMSDGGDCDLKTKFRNAYDAGYSAIIVGSEELHEEITKPGVFMEDDEEFIDVHLVHPLDIKVLSEDYAYPNEGFTMDPPRLSRCKEEYQRTWLRSRYVSLALRTWKRSMELIWECVKWLLHLLGTITKGITSPQVFHNHNRDTFASVAISLAAIIFSITVMMLISINNSAEKVLKYKSFQEGQFSFKPTAQEEEPKPKFEDKPIPKESKPVPESKSNSTGRTPPSTPPPTPEPSTQRVPFDRTVYHRLNLGIKLNAKLTIAQVKNAYREMALRYHPDKNRHLDDQSLAKITEEFKNKKKSRDILLMHCTE